MRKPAFSLVSYHSLSWAWSDYFNKSITYEEKNECEEFTSSNSTRVPNLGDAYILNCYFHDVHSTGSGGAILYSVAQSNILVEKCSFLNCSASGYTAAIRITLGNAVIAQACAQNCHSGDSDGFCSIWSDSQNRTINSVIESSIAHCISGNRYTMHQEYGFVRIMSVNLSHNQAKMQSTIGSDPSKMDEETGLFGLLMYCAIANNTAEQEGCITMTHLLVSQTQSMIKNSNIIFNKGEITIRGNSDTKMIECCVMNNTDAHVFSGRITLYNCSVGTDQFNGFTPNIDHIGTTTFINGLTFINTGFCIASLDHIGAISIHDPYENPIRTMHEKCCQCNTWYQELLSNYKFSILSAFEYLLIIGYIPINQ